MLTLTRDEYDALEIADNARRTLTARSVTAGATATRALVDYAETVIGTDHAKDLWVLLTTSPDRTLGECLDAMDYTIGQATPEPTGRKCHVVIRNAADCDCTMPVRAFADSDAAAEFSGNTDAGRDTYVLAVDFEPAPLSDADLLAAMLAASERVDLDIDGPDLDILAYDIADTMDRGEYGLGDITSDDIRAVLPAFLAACLAHADANTVHCDRCGKEGQSLCEECVERRAES